MFSGPEFASYEGGGVSGTGSRSGDFPSSTSRQEGLLAFCANVLLHSSGTLLHKQESGGEGGESLQGRPPGKHFEGCGQMETVQEQPGQRLRVKGLGVHGCVHQK